LRYYGYFKEAVVESKLETYRVRRVEIMYYLEDHTLMISEPRIENSGVPQGKFLKRRQVLKEDKSGLPILPFDIQVGKDIAILGRHYRITDADEYTRQFYVMQKKPLAKAQEIPVDSFAESQIPKPKFRDTELKEFMERSLGGGRVSSEKQFLDNDRHVLRFYTRWDDLPFVIHYYLADDTVEIREVHHPNDGRDSFAQLLKRRKLPYSFAVGQPGHAQIGENYLTCDQIFPGKPIQAYGRNFVVTGVDHFTRDYYNEKFGRIFALGDIEQPQPREPIERQIPPHNGFGDEIDSLGYVFKLLPEKPKRDFFKYVDNDKTVLRYTARFNTRVPEDVDRKFIISFFLADNSISIFEPAQKNSGIIEGKFLERAKYKNVDRAGEFVTPTDMPMGGSVKINGYNFLIESCDEFTSKWLETHLV
jgi:hypothetical protein